MTFINKFQKNLSKYGVRETTSIFLRFISIKLNPSKNFYIPNKNTGKGDILIVTGEHKNANSYYRCEMMKYQLETINVSVDIVSDKYLNLLEVDKYKKVIIYRSGDINLLNYLKTVKNKTQFIFSIDDLIYEVAFLEINNEKEFLVEQDFEKLKLKISNMNKIMSMCGKVISSTEFLSSKLDKYFKRENIYTHRNGYMDKFDHLLVDKSSNSKTIIGYFSGSDSHRHDLEMITKPLVNIMNLNPDIEIWIGGWVEYDFGIFNNRVKKLPYMNRDEYMKTLSKIDINLLPLQENDFNNAKSEIKFIEAGLVEVPTIASKVGDLKNVLKGEFCIVEENTKEKWEKALTLLIHNTSLRKQIGKNARKFILNTYKPEKLAQPLKEFIFG